MDADSDVLRAAERRSVPTLPGLSSRMGVRRLGTRGPNTALSRLWCGIRRA